MSTTYSEMMGAIEQARFVAGDLEADDARAFLHMQEIKAHLGLAKIQLQYMELAERNPR